MKSRHTPGKDSPPRNLAAIAEKAGVCRMSVSLALRGRPGVSAETRERILSIAKSIGYRVNPLVSAYQAHIRSRRPESYQATIAWINDHPERDFWDWQALHGYLAGAEQRADELGFKLERFHLPLFGDNPAKARAALQRMLRNRDIHGVILPWLYGIEHAEADWSDFSVAMIGRNVGYEGNSREVLPLFHHTNPDTFYNTGLALRRLKELGITRVGLALTDANDELAGGLQRACYYVRHDREAAQSRVPVFFARDMQKATERRKFIAWYQEHQPQAIVLYNLGWMELLPARRGPPPLPVQLNLIPGSHVHGIDTRHAAISAACVDLVVNQLYQNERGQPATVKEVLVKGLWRTPPNENPTAAHARAQPLVKLKR